MRTFPANGSVVLPLCWMALRAENARLRQQVGGFSNVYETQTRALLERDAEIERLREALEVILEFAEREYDKPLHSIRGCYCPKCTWVRPMFEQARAALEVTGDAG